ncbi:secretin receptor [Ambystoma mexicanum]|uniref:secretin receptor n=1 Tax=Ambystoma mexicanum TaxID=8296 RepID=UPI0037E9B7EE
MLKSQSVGLSGKGLWGRFCGRTEAALPAIEVRPAVRERRSLSRAGCAPLTPQAEAPRGALRQAQQSVTMWGVLLLSFFIASTSANQTVQLKCDLLLLLDKEKEHCFESLSEEKQNTSQEQWLLQGVCPGMWDNLNCWPSASVGNTVFSYCSEVLQIISGSKERVYRNCTSDGWSETFPQVHIACGYDLNDTSSDDGTSYYTKLKVLYTVGYGTSLAALIMALAILGSFRRLRCTRNYIHMHLFASFLLRALSIFIKDAFLFSTEDIYHCSGYLPGCKLVLVLFQYCIMANYSWLLVEAMYLHTLLVVSFFSERKYFWWYIALGWGSPLVFVIAWSICRQLYEDIGCWDINTDASIWWIIRGPVIISIFINFILFVRIVRILRKKLKTSDLCRDDFGQYKRLARSTLLLIPLFGVHYIIFAFFPEDVSSRAVEIRLLFELALGSFQGFVVAVLYCFLNGEVQCEIQRKLRQRDLSKDLQSRQKNSSNSGSSASTLVMHSSKSSPKDQRRIQAPNTSVI